MSLSDNPLNGAIPPQLANLANLQTVNFFINRLTGDIPVELANRNAIISRVARE